MPHSSHHLWYIKLITDSTVNGAHWTLLTHSTVQSPSWAANRFAASQEIPRISRNPNVHYRTHKRPPPVSILGQPNPVHIPTPHLMEIHPNIIHPSTPRSPQWSPSLRFPHQDPIHSHLLTHTRHMPSPSHSSRFYQLFCPTHKNSHCCLGCWRPCEWGIRRFGIRCRVAALLVPDVSRQRTGLFFKGRIGYFDPWRWHHNMSQNDSYL